MKLSKLCAISLVVVAAGSTATLAQETVDWNGFYAGVFGGYAGGTSNLTLSPPGGAPGVPVSASGDIGGLFGGLTLGVNYQLQQGFVVGAEADIGVADISGNSAFAAGPGLAFPLTTEVSTQGSLRGRVGYAVDRFLPFATAGLAVGHIRQGINTGIGGGGAGVVDIVNETTIGWTVGAGVEYAVTDAISVKAEYRYSQFDSGTDTAIVFGGADSNTTFSTHDVRIGVNYRF